MEKCVHAQKPTWREWDEMPPEEAEIIRIIYRKMREIKEE